MGLFNVLTNQVKAAVGYQQSFAELLDAKDVSRALTMMYDKNGNFLRWSKRWKIPIPYQPFINEIALVFLYGRPVKWGQLSEGTDEAFENYKNLNDEVHFNARVREAKRAAGSEGTAAILYHVYRDKEDNPRLLLNVLCKKNGDDIYTVKDQYKRLTAFAWGYYLTEAGNRTVYHVDIYTADTIYRAKRGNIGWEVAVLQNPVGKIPVLLFEQEVEHAGVQAMIERSESLESTDADVNDRFANPAMVATAEILNSLPKSEDEAKLFILKDGGKIEYLTWDQASQSKANEYERLDKHILSKSFTPNIDFDNMKNLGNLSAKAIRKVMLLAVIKAEKRKETEFQEPFGDDVSEMLADVLKQYGAGALSLQSTLELSYLVKNAQKEYEQINKEQAEALERQMALNRTDVFGEGE
mgnify:CR=1 FL=1